MESARKKEQLQKYRRKISISYFTLGIAAVMITLTGGITFLFLNEIILFKIMSMQMAWFGLAFTWYLFNHRYNLLASLEDKNTLSITALESYLDDHKRYWDNLYPLKLLTGCAIAIAFLISLFNPQGELLSQILAGLLLTYLLAMILKVWLDFRDQILLQDIRHYFRDHSS